MDYKQLIEDNFCILNRSLLPSSEFFRHLRTSDYIRQNMKDIQQQPTAEDKTEKLLSVLTAVPDDLLESTMETFMSALRVSGQDHVANVVRRETDSTLMSDEHHELLSSKVEELCKFVEPRDGLVNMLVQSKVFTPENRSCVVSKTNVDDMARETLYILLHKTECAFNKFVEVLKKQGQDHVVYILTGQGKAPMSDAKRNLLHAEIRKLSRTLDPENEILLSLRSDGIINYMEWSRLKSQPPGSTMVTELIDTLVRKSDSAFSYFIESLKESRQDHVVYILTGEGTGRPISDIDREALKENMEYLVNTMDPIHSGLLTALYANGVVTTVEHERLQSSFGDTYFDKIEMLINMISRKSQESFDKFIAALNTTKQGHIADTLQGVHVEGNVELQLKEGEHSDARLSERCLQTSIKTWLLNDDNNNCDENVKELTDRLRDGGICVDDVKEGSIRISFRCKDQASTVRLRKLHNSCELSDRFTMTFCGNQWDHGALSLSIQISDEEFERAGRVFREIRPMSQEHKEALRSAVESVTITDELLKDLCLQKRAKSAVRADDTEDHNLLSVMLSRRPDVQFQQLHAILQVQQESEAILQGTDMFDNSSETAEKWELECKRLQNEVFTLTRLNELLVIEKVRLSTKLLLNQSSPKKAASGTVIQKISTGDAFVLGVTSLDDELFVLLQQGISQVAVYSIHDYQLMRAITLPGLEPDEDSDMTSCSRNKSLYISDPIGDCIVKSDLLADAISYWKVPGSPCGLSVTPSCNLLVTCQDEPQNKLVELSGISGQTVREVSLQSDIAWPWHSAQLTSGQYVVCHGHVGLRRVCVVDADGSVVYSGEGGELEYPCHMAVNSESQFIFVADYYKHRVMLLNPMLGFVRYFTKGVGYPWRLYLHQNKGHLYVGQTQNETGINVIQV